MDFKLNNKAQLTTRYIQNGRDCAKIKGSSPLQHRNGLIGLRPAIAHICIYPSVGSNCATETYKQHKKQVNASINN